MTAFVGSRQVDGVHSKKTQVKRLMGPEGAAHFLYIARHLQCVGGVHLGRREREKRQLFLADRQALKKRAQRESKVTKEGDERPAIVLFLFLCAAKTRPPSA